MSVYYYQFKCFWRCFDILFTFEEEEEEGEEEEEEQEEEQEQEQEEQEEKQKKKKERVLVVSWIALWEVIQTYWLEHSKMNRRQAPVRCWLLLPTHRAKALLCIVYRFPLSCRYREIDKLYFENEQMFVEVRQQGNALNTLMYILNVAH